MRLRVCVGDIVAWRGVDAIVVSANRALQGSASPGYWRFAGRQSVDGAVRLASGAELARAAERAVAGTDRGWCEAGQAVVTPAFGAVAQAGSSHVIHVVVPDGLQVHAGGSDHHVQDTATPVLHKCFRAVLTAATSCGARSVAMPALGCGVKAWRPRLVAEVAAYAIADAVAGESGRPTTHSSKNSWSGTNARAIDAVDFVMHSDEMARHWAETFGAIFGPSVESSDRNAPAATWNLCQQVRMTRQPGATDRSCGSAMNDERNHSAIVHQVVEQQQEMGKAKAEAKRALLTHRTLQRVRNRSGRCNRTT
jgi:O-acetyl-ADP-ribose deacetylase (regulator of RNase III)